MQNILGQWLVSLKHYGLMCFLLSSPDRLPYNVYNIAISGFAYFLIGLLLVNEHRSYALISAQILLELGMLGVICFVGLSYKKLLGRYQQTYSALVGINAIITAVTIPASRIAVSQGNIDESLLITVTLALLIWNLAVLSWIFKNAFEISTHLSAILSFAYFVIYQVTTVWLFP